MCVVCVCVKCGVCVCVWFAYVWGLCLSVLCMYGVYVCGVCMCVVWCVYECDGVFVLCVW